MGTRREGVTEETEPMTPFRRLGPRSRRQAEEHHGRSMDVLRAALVILLISLGAKPAAATLCVMGGVAIFPPPGRVPRNVVWYLDDAASLLEGASKASLRAAGEVVPLLARSASGKPATQVRLEPARALQPGVTYELVLEYPAGPEPRPAPMVVGAWTVGAEEDHDLPSWRGPIRATARSSVLMYRRSDEILFTGETSEEPVLIRVVVERGGSSTGESLLLFGYPSLHSGPCSHNFSVAPGRTYDFTLYAIDSAGNWSEKLGQAVRVETPAEPVTVARDLGQAGKLPHASGELFTDAQWEAAIAEVEKVEEWRRPAAFLPYDPKLLDRVTFTGLPQERASRLLFRGGDPWRGPGLQGTYLHYVMRPAPRCYEWTLVLTLEYDDDMRIIVVREVLEPRRHC